MVSNGITLLIKQERKIRNKINSNKNTSDCEIGLYDSCENKGDAFLKVEIDPTGTP